jgi:hypothetical protein
MYLKTWPYNPPLSFSSFVNNSGDLLCTKKMKPSDVGFRGVRVKREVFLGFRFGTVYVFSRKCRI